LIEDQDNFSTKYDKTDLVVSDKKMHFKTLSGPVTHFMKPTRTVWRIWVGVHPKIIPVQFGENPANGFGVENIIARLTMDEGRSNMSDTIVTLCSGDLTNLEVMLRFIRGIEVEVKSSSKKYFFYKDEVCGTACHKM